MSHAAYTLDELLAHAHALEKEAVERYEDLAGQMEAHNRPELAEMFRKMVAVEQVHVDKVEALAGGQPERFAPWDYRWQTLEAPESVPIGQGHYRMSPYQALTLMLACEQRAEAFFVGAAETADDPAVRETAAQFAAEEKQHADLLKEWLTRYPQPQADWREDLDDPVSQE